MQTRWTNIAGVLALAASGGCGVLDGFELPTGAPTKVEMLADQGFQNAGAVEASPDGKTFYVAAYDEQRRPGVFSVSVATGEVGPVYVGEPLNYPTDLAVSCDGSSIYVGDLGLGSSIDALVGDFADDAQPTNTAIHLLTPSGEISSFSATGIARAAGLVVDTECENLYVAGFSDAGLPALFTVPLAGGEAKVLFEGEPLVSPTGVHVDKDKVAWVMDHSAAGENGDGMLFSVDDNGNIAEVASGLGMGRHGGVSLAPGGTTAVVPVSDELAGSRLVTANTKTGEMSSMDVPDIQQPTGVAAARDAAVMVVAGESSIHIATFE